MYYKAQDYTKAAQWYRNAAEQGLAEAQYILGAMYANGQGVSRDDKEAEKWYHKAAEQGLAEAQQALEAMNKKVPPQEIIDQPEKPTEKIKLGDSKENNTHINNYYMYGFNNSINIAEGCKVEQFGSIISITTESLEKLREYGVEDKEIVELKEIVENNQQDKKSMKSKIGKWLSSVIASVTAKGLYDHIPVITEIINKIM